MKKANKVLNANTFVQQRWIVLLVLSLGLVLAAIATRSPTGGTIPTLAATQTVLHFQGNVEDPSAAGGSAPNCTGVGATDITACNGPFLTESSVLSAATAAHWDPNSALSGATNRTVYDTSWVWRPAAPTTIGGTVTIEWWADVNAAATTLGMEWRIKLSNQIGGPTNATGAPAAGEFYHAVHAGSAVTPPSAGVPAKLTATLTGVPLTDVSNGMVLVIEPRYSDTGADSHIWYDSALACPGAAAGPCDSTITVAVYAPGETPTPTPTPSVTPTPPPPSACSLNVPTFDNYQPPAEISPGVPYPRRDNSGEPSIGVNWNTGNVLAMSRLRANRATFDDSTSPAHPLTGTRWHSEAIETLVTGLDPILFTDPVTGRTIAGELQGAGGATNGVITDDDLHSTAATFQTGGPSQGFDHQSIGGGPTNPNAPAERQPLGPYPHMVYYASQQAAYGSVATSRDGGLTYGPALPAYTIAECGGIHGHIKVAPDGTVYFPNKNCGGRAAVIVSEDNGLNWQIRRVPTSTSIGGISDPSVGIGAGGRVFLSYTGADRKIRVAVSDDKGLTWHDDVELSALAPVDAIVTGPQTGGLFPAVVSGDNNRAAVFFLGTSSTDPGDEFGSVPTTNATWFPYMASTCDGKTWSVVRADNDPLNPGIPNPLQIGPVCTSGTACPSGPPNTRNLLDFNDVQVDARGRVHAVYADGCNWDHNPAVGSPCYTYLSNNGNSNNNQAIARLTIIRQRGGMRLFGAFDAGGPAPPPLPLAVLVEEGKTGNALKWAEPDNGGSPLTGYRIYRGAVGRGEALIAQLKPGTYKFHDRGAQRSSRVYYRVTAVNRLGESPKNAKVFVKGRG